MWIQYQANYGYLKSTHKIQIKFYSKAKLWFTIYWIDQVDLGDSYLEPCSLTSKSISLPIQLKDTPKAFFLILYNFEYYSIEKVKCFCFNMHKKVEAHGPQSSSERQFLAINNLGQRHLYSRTPVCREKMKIYQIKLRM